MKKEKKIIRNAYIIDNLTGTNLLHSFEEMYSIGPIALILLIVGISTSFFEKILFYLEDKFFPFLIICLGVSVIEWLVNVLRMKFSSAIIFDIIYVFSKFMSVVLGMLAGVSGFIKLFNFINFDVLSVGILSRIVLFMIICGISLGIIMFIKVLINRLVCKK